MNDAQPYGAAHAGLKLGRFDWNTETGPTFVFLVAVLFPGVA